MPSNNLVIVNKSHIVRVYAYPKEKDRMYKSGKESTGSQSWQQHASISSGRCRHENINKSPKCSLGGDSNNDTEALKQSGVAPGYEDNAMQNLENIHNQGRSRVHEAVRLYQSWTFWLVHVQQLHSLLYR